MKTATCRCGNRIFFNNHHCVACDAVLGRCMACSSLTSVSGSAKAVVCDSCGVAVHPCTNQLHGVCQSFNGSPDTLCRYCEFTDVTPTLDQPQSVRRWAAMEAAKRRLLVQLEELHLPPFMEDLQQTHPLRFAFKEDTQDADGQTIKVTTGHENGLITINLAEADSVHRERLRVQLGEPQRTLIGHMRHEVGHYIDWSFASRVAADQYRQLFGDPDAIDYGEAMQRHYDLGPPQDWADSHVSAYATMHPWEDFAETVNVYLDIMAIATTANQIGRSELDLSPAAIAAQLVGAVLEIVIEVSEYNFDLGLLPLLPERLPAAVVDKLSYVHALRSQTLSEVSTAKTT